MEEGSVRVDFVTERDHLRKCILAAWTKCPTEIGTLIADFAETGTDVIYFSMSIDMVSLPDICKCDFDLLDMLTRFWYFSSPLLLDLKDLKDEAAVNILSIQNLLHGDPVHTIHQVRDKTTNEVMCSFTRSGYVVKGADLSHFPPAPTTVIGGCLVTGPTGVGKRRVVLRALKNAKDHALPAPAAYYEGRTSSRCMVIVTTDAKIAKWEQDLRIFSSWTIVYVHTEKFLYENIHRFATSDLIVINRKVLRFLAQTKECRLWTTLWRLVVIDDTGSLVSQCPTEEHIVHVSSQAMRIKTAFPGQQNILISLDTDLDRVNFVDTCAFLSTVTTNGIFVYPPPFSLHDKLRHAAYEHRDMSTFLYTSGSYHFGMNHHSRRNIQDHFIRQHVIALKGPQ
jgi:hypothetical protein